MGSSVKRAAQLCLQAAADRGPLCGDDAVEDAIALVAVAEDAVVAPDAFPGCAESFDRPLRAEVSKVGLDRYPDGFLVEGVAQ